MIAYAFTVFWLLGLLEFCAQVLIQGASEKTWGVSVLIFFFAFMGTIFSQKAKIVEALGRLFREWKVSPGLFKILTGLTAILFLVAFWESLYPPHLNQELDALNYHMTLPRQHLFRGNFDWISWSVADLWPMPLQFGLAPAWFMGNTLNKWPQFFAVLNAFFLLLALGRAGDESKSWRGWIPALAVFTTHGVMIQLGTAMLDLTILYFTIAALHSLIRRRVFWTSIHLAVLFTSKAFNPIQMSIIIVFTLVAIFVLHRKTGAKVPAEYSSKESIKFLKKSLVWTGLLSLVILSRSIYLGLKYVGTPMYPFLVSASASPGILAGAASHLRTRTDYGYGHGFVAFLKHFWLVSVPTHQVNNVYDYPLGLAWLFMLILLFSACLRWWKSGGKTISVPGVLAMAFWITWWMGSHQSRWLYPVIALGWLSTLGEQRRMQTFILTGSLCVSAFFSVFSEVRGFQEDIHKTPLEVQHEQEAAVLSHKIGPDVLDSRNALFYKGRVQDIVGEDVRWIVPHGL